MTDINQVVAEMPEEIYLKLVSAVEIGKWEDGTALTPEQKESTMQVVMMYQAKHLDQHDHFTINRHGEINELSKTQLKKAFKGESIAEFKEKDM
ncbi:YeaC family protein [Shewanella gelidii]|uniref:DUF1315 family protein n=1 Tax=Shewanella gelidii TaxID=1642821 RepID=A0A917JYZ1_9GAMM|nr:DUF1315 family protein [Shewanella gelidii]MCL1098152.1 DUF1315 family protein [Shewanella gelidii]GGI90976.1 hypothetical protein GCM10009332_30290 [Shewanella gelidii]